MKYLTLIAIIWTCVGACGCVVDMPMVSREGAITGGDPKLGGVLRKISEMQEANSVVAGVNVLEYVAVIQPTAQAVIYRGVLPAKGNRLPAGYSILCSEESLRMARLCTITETIEKKEESGRLRVRP